MLLKRQHSDNIPALRELFTEAGDTEALAGLDRTIMGQSTTITTDR